MTTSLSLNPLRDLKVRILCKHHAHGDHEFDIITVELRDNGHHFRLASKSLDLGIECNLPSLHSFRVDQHREPSAVSAASHDCLFDLAEYFTNISLLLACEVIKIDVLREHYTCVRNKFGRTLGEAVISAIETLQANIQIERVNTAKKDELSKSLTSMQRRFQERGAGFQFIEVDEHGVHAAGSISPEMLLDILTGKGFKI